MTTEEVLECYAAGRLTLDHAMEWIRQEREIAITQAKLALVRQIMLEQINK